MTRCQRTLGTLAADAGDGDCGACGHPYVVHPDPHDPFIVECIGCANDDGRAAGRRAIQSLVIRVDLDATLTARADIPELERVASLAALRAVVDRLVEQESSREHH